MSKRTIRKRISELRSQGVSKVDMFRELKGLAYSDGRLAYLLTSRADPGRVRGSKWSVRLMIVIALLQVALSFFGGWQVGAAVSADLAILGGLIATVVPAWTAYGFLKHHVLAYNFFIVISLLQYGVQVSDVVQGYNAAWVGVGFSAVMLMFVCFLRRRLFPDVWLVRPARDVSGGYAFA